MRNKVVRMLAMALLLGGAGISAAQQPAVQGSSTPDNPAGLPKQKQKAAPAKSKLEEMLAEALKNNPDIRVAAANLTLAEAELNRTRLQVTQKVLTLYHAIQSQQATVNYEQKQYDRMQGLLKDRAIDSTLVEKKFAKLTAAKAKLEELEAQLPALLGKSPQTEYELTIQQAKLLRQEASRSSLQTRRTLLEEAEWEKAHKATGATAERLRKALQTPVTVDFKNMKLNAILDDLAKKVVGASFRVLRLYEPEQKLNLCFKEALPLSAVLQALADESQCCFYVREYGILATRPDAAPPGAMKVEELLRQKPADEPRRPSSSGKNPPAESVEGLVKSVDASGLIKISIGSDAGLAKGHTLELFRINSSSPKESKYLGIIRILEAEAHESIAQAVGRLADTPKAGDRVASRIEDNQDAKPEGAKPRNRVEGQITKVYANGQVEVNIGVKDGMQGGDVLKVYRPKPERTFLGTIRIEGGLGARSAKCRPQGQLTAPIQSGDHVISDRERPFDRSQF